MATIVAICRDDVDLPLATLQSVLYRFGERARTEVVVRCLSSDFASPICKMIQPIFGGTVAGFAGHARDSMRSTGSIVLLGVVAVNAATIVLDRAESQFGSDRFRFRTPMEFVKRSSVRSGFPHLDLGRVALHTSLITQHCMRTCRRCNRRRVRRLRGGGRKRDGGNRQAKSS